MLTVAAITGQSHDNPACWESQTAKQTRPGIKKLFCTATICVNVEVDASRIVCGHVLSTDREAIHTILQAAETHGPYKEIKTLVGLCAFKIWKETQALPDRFKEIKPKPRGVETCSVCHEVIDNSK